jgi:cyclopropane-fatty-acyl-phospholipid synthase
VEAGIATGNWQQRNDGAPRRRILEVRMASGQVKPAFLPLLGRALRKTIKRGSLTIIDSRGGVSSFGDGAEIPSATIRFHTRWLPLKIVLDPALGAGEAYMHGLLTIEKGDLRSFLAVAMDQPDPIHERPLLRTIGQIGKWIARALGGNNRKRSARNVAYHYDLSPEFYALFLDSDLHYSCAYFAQGTETLEEAQAAKARHIAAKLCLAPGQTVLDIGSGWGSLALAMAQMADVRVKGVTLSREQLDVARSRARDVRVNHNVQFELEDYRDVAGKFDRIVSVGMLEHVGFAQFDGYFAKVAELLAPDGVALIHAIGRWDDNPGTDAWTQRYIFPGGYIPSLSEVIPAIERSGLLTADIEILRLHYAETLLHWSRRFAASRATACGMYGEEFCRMWEFYLGAAEMSFRARQLMVFQIQLIHQRDAIPLTRDYMTQAETRLATAKPDLLEAAE